MLRDVNVTIDFNDENSFLKAFFFTHFRIKKIKVDETQYIDRIGSDPNFKGAYGQSLIRILYFDQISPNRKKGRFKICKEIFLTIPVVIYTKKNFYLLDALNEKIDILKASGLIDFWHFQDIDERLLNVKETRDPKVLTINHLSGCFQILFLGYFASFVVFAFELLLVKVRKASDRDFCVKKALRCFYFHQN